MSKSKLGRLIINESELLENLMQVECYLSGDEGESNRLEMISLIKRGFDFVAYKVDDKWRFAPSRFLGYLSNTLIKHLVEGNGKHGTQTSHTLDKILGKYKEDTTLDKIYIQFCRETLGTEPKNMIKGKRKYWTFTKDVISNYEKDSFREGDVKERYHAYIERNPKLVRLVKSNFAKVHNGKLFCEICGFDFSKQYGEIGEGYIEAHHTIPVSEMKEGDVTKPEDMKLVCANCHRMIHSKAPCYTIDEIKQHIK